MKLFLASEKYYVKPDDKEGAGLLIVAPNSKVALATATFSWPGTFHKEPDPRNCITPNYDIFELGKFRLTDPVKEKVSRYPENMTGGVGILEFYEDPEFKNEELALRNYLSAKYAEDKNHFAYSDALSKIRKTYFSFTEVEGWTKRFESHFNLEVDVWVSPKYSSFITQLLAGNKNDD